MFAMHCPMPGVRGPAPGHRGSRAGLRETRAESCGVVQHRRFYKQMFLNAKTITSLLIYTDEQDIRSIGW